MVSSVVKPLAVSLGLAAFPAVQVRPPPGDADCPSGRAVAAALQARAVAAAGGASADSDWTLSYDETAPSPEGGRLRIEMRDSAGRLKLTRAIGTAASSCAETAEAIGVIVERYFTGIGWSTGASLPPPGLSTPAAGPDSGGLPRGVRLGAGPALWYSGDWSVRAAFDLRAKVAGPLTVGIGTFGPSAHRAQGFEGGGRAELRSWGWPARLSLTLATPLGQRFAVEGGFDGVFSLENGSTAETPTTGSARRLAAGLGAGALVSLRLASRWLLQAEVAGYRSLGSEFTVTDDDRSRHVLAIPAWRGLASLRLAFVAWP